MLSFVKRWLRFNRNFLLACRLSGNRTHSIPCKPTTSTNLAKKSADYHRSFAAYWIRYSSSDLVGIVICERGLLHALIRQLIPVFPNPSSNLRFSNRHLVIHLVQTINCSWSDYTRTGSCYPKLDYSCICSNSRWYRNPDDLDRS